MIDEKDIQDLKTALMKSTGEIPRDMFHRDYGWVLRDGKPTETFEAFYDDIIAPSLEKEKNEQG